MEAIRILYGSNRFIFRNGADLSSFYSVGLKEHACIHASSAYTLGLDPSIWAGRFHYITSLTLAPMRDAFGDEWRNLLQSLPLSASGDRNPFPHLKILDIDVTELHLPLYWLLNVEELLENVSDLNEIRLRGVEILPLRLFGILRGVRSCKEQITADDPRILKAADTGQWTLVA
jgi:hypothetical protein